MPDGERESLEHSQGSWCLPQRGDASVLSSSSRQVLNSGIRKPGLASPCGSRAVGLASELEGSAVLSY